MTKPSDRDDEAEARTIISRAEAKERLVKRIAALSPEERAKITESVGTPRPPSPWLTPQIMLMLIGLLSGGAVGVGGFVIHLWSELGIATRGVDEARTRATIWIPRIERGEEKLAALDAANKIQDGRMENLVDAIRDMRRGNDTIASKLSSISEDLAAIKARMGLDRRTENKANPSFGETR